MRKFTLKTQFSDTDSGCFSAGATSSDSSFRVQDPKDVLFIKVQITSLGRQLYISATGKALVNHVKQKLLDQFGSQLTDSVNHGIFQPPENGKNGKFLEEDRPLSAYLSNESNTILELVYKKRLNIPTITNLPVVDKTKNLPQNFLRCVAKGDIKKVEKMLAKGFDPNFLCPRTEESPLTVAVTKSKPYAMISVLIAGGAHKDFRTRGGLTALHKAASIGNFEAVKALLDFGQSPNILDANGLTPLYHNILGDTDTRICHRLLYEHAQIGIYDYHGKQEIHQAALLDRTNQINLLIMYDVDVNTRSLTRPTQDPPGLPALPQRASKSTNQRQVSLLHRICGGGGETPLHFAAIAGHSGAARRLLERGADPLITNDERRTPVDEALRHGHHEVAEIIRSFRGDQSQRSSCGPFLPHPTYNPRRKPMVGPLQPSIDDPVNVIEFGVERKGPTRSVTMPFPVSPSRHSPVATSVLPTPPFQRQHTDELQTYLPTPSLASRLVKVSDAEEREPRKSLRIRASSEGDLLRSVDDGEDGRGRKRKPGQRNPQRRRRRLLRQAEVLDGDHQNADQISKPVRNKQRLKSWKSSNTLNDQDDTSSEEEVYPARSRRETKRKELRFKSETSGSATIERNMYTTAPRRSKEYLLSCESVNTYTERNVNTNQSRAAPVPANPFALSPVRSESPKHHFPHLHSISPASPRSSIYSRSEANSDPIVAPSRSHAMETTVNKSMSQHVMGQVRTIFMRKAYLPDAPREPTFGLSLRTVKNASAVHHFTPTAAKPSLQLIKHVKAGSPALNVGLREGDYVIKINSVDVTRASHSEVIRLLNTLRSDTVSLEVVRPIFPQACTIPQETLENYYVSSNRNLITSPQKSCRSSITSESVSLANPSRGVQRSVSMAQRGSPQSRMESGPKITYVRTISPSRIAEGTFSGDESMDQCSSIISNDDAFFNQSGECKSSIMLAPNCVDQRSHMPLTNLPRMHSAADYRIRSQFPNLKYYNVETTHQPPSAPGPQLPQIRQPSHRTLPKSNTFSEEIGKDSMSLNSYVSNRGVSSHRAPSARRMESVRPVFAVDQPPMRFLPHYTSPTHLQKPRPLVHPTTPEVTYQRRRDRSLVNHHPGQSMSSVGVAPITHSRRPLSLGYALANEFVESSRRPLKLGGNVGTRNDEPEMIVPPPEEFCC